MPAVFRKLIEWNVDGRSFCFIADGLTGELQTPDGQTLTLSLDEWQTISLALREIALAKKRKGAAKASNNGQPWSKELDAQLSVRWAAGADLKQLSAEFGRTRGGIAARLVRLGHIDSRREATLRQAAALPPGKHDDGNKPS